MNTTVKGTMDEDFFPFLNVFVFDPETFDVCKDVKAIIDTGAEDCLVKNSFAKKLGLAVIDKQQELNPVDGITEAELYKVGLIVDTQNYMDTSKYAVLTMGTIEDEDYPADMILGGTFLRHCTFNYDGRNKAFELHVML